jgi:hypothetical protein
MIDNNISTANEELENRFNFAMCGKLTPYGRQKGSRGNREGLKLLNRYCPRSYPKHLKTDKDKFIFLKDVLGRNEVTEEIFIDLTSMLSIKKDSIYEALSGREVSILDLVGGKNENLNLWG